MPISEISVKKLTEIIKFTLIKINFQRNWGLFMFSWEYAKKYFEKKGEWKASEIELHRT